MLRRRFRNVQTPRVAPPGGENLRTGRSIVQRCRRLARPAAWPKSSGRRCSACRFRRRTRPTWRSATAATTPAHIATTDARERNPVPWRRASPPAMPTNGGACSNRLAAIGIPHVIFTGGEPTLVDGLTESDPRRGRLGTGGRPEHQRPAVGRSQVHRVAPSGRLGSRANHAGIAPAGGSQRHDRRGFVRRNGRRRPKRLGRWAAHDHQHHAYAAEPRPCRPTCRIPARARARIRSP